MMNPVSKQVKVIDEKYLDVQYTSHCTLLVLIIFCAVGYFSLDDFFFLPLRSSC